MDLQRPDPSQRDLTLAPLPLDAARSMVTSRILDTIHAIGQLCCLVIDDDIRPAISLTTSRQQLSADCAHVCCLSETVPVSLLRQQRVGAVVFIIRSTIPAAARAAEVACALANQPGLEQLSFSVFCTPSVSAAVLHTLDRRAPPGTTPRPLVVDIAPLDTDLALLAPDPTFLRRTLVEADAAAAVEAGTAWARLQAEVIGPVGTVLAVGPAALAAARVAQSVIGDGAGVPVPPTVAAAVLFDRSVDLATPLMAQLSYVGVMADADRIDATLTTRPGLLNEDGVPVDCYPCTSDEPIFAAIRDTYFFPACRQVSERFAELAAMSQITTERFKNDASQISSFVATDLPQYLKERKAVRVQTFEATARRSTLLEPNSYDRVQRGLDATTGARAAADAVAAEATNTVDMLALPPLGPSEFRRALDGAPFELPVGLADAAADAYRARRMRASAEFYGAIQRFCLATQLGANVASKSLTAKASPLRAFTDAVVQVGGAAHAVTIERLVAAHVLVPDRTRPPKAFKSLDLTSQKPDPAVNAVRQVYSSLCPVVARVYELFTAAVAAPRPEEQLAQLAKLLTAELSTGVEVLTAPAAALAARGRCVTNTAVFGLGGLTLAEIGAVRLAAVVRAETAADGGDVTVFTSSVLNSRDIVLQMASTSSEKHMDQYSTSQTAQIVDNDNGGVETTATAEKGRRWGRK